MSSLTDEHPQARKRHRLGALLWRFASIILILLTPWVFYRDLKDAYDEGVKQEKSGTFAGRLKFAVEAQLAVLQGVDAGSLGSTYFTSLQSTECSWLFQCYPIRVAEPPNPLSAKVLDTPLFQKGMEMALAPTAPTPAPPVALPSFVKPHEMPGGPVPSSPRSPDLVSPFLDGAKQPQESEADRVRRENLAQIEKNLKLGEGLTLPDKSGTGASSSSTSPDTNPASAPAISPHPATLPDLYHRGLSTDPPIKTVAAAPAIFTKLGPIWLPTLHTMRGSPHAFHQMLLAIHDAGTWATTMYLSCTLIWITLWLRKMPLMLYLLFFGGPFSIPLMVSLMQWICEQFLKLGIVGCTVAMGLMALLPSTALALLVGLHHAAKSPREFLEAVEHLKH